MAYPGTKPVTLVEKIRPNRYCEVCGKTPAQISVIWWEDGPKDHIRALDARRTHYFCADHRGEALVRRDVMTHIADAEREVHARQGNWEALREWWASLDAATQEIFRRIRKNTPVVRLREPDEPIRFQRLDPLFPDLHDVSAELKEVLAKVAG